MARICIYGAGTIGCYLGGRLLAGGSDVTFIGRKPAGEELHRHGLSLSDYRGGHWRHEPAVIAFATSAAAAATAELVLVTVKSAGTATAAAELAAVLQPGTVVLSLQNGIGNAGLLRAALPGQSVLAGMVPFNVVKSGPGAYHQGSEGLPHAQAAPALDPFLPSFTAAALPLTTHDDILPVLWAKLLLNLNNAVNALSGLPLREELGQHSYRQCLALAQEEALAMLEGVGIMPAKLTPLPARWLPSILRLPDALFRRLARQMLAIDPLARSSMADDLAAGRATEIDWLNGEVVRLAERLGREAPVNSRLIALIRDVERNEGRQDWPGGALLAELLGSAAGRAAVQSAPS
ncbi:2-dehydropantoate 2-reductase [Bosea sp. WAO]|uniref:2-dehydropantoate 2-reductase n=1 Tax=Bosea sp. WAO TaxID=406341 RepID=UPI000746FED7|nr:2-dehydropantoate 2-reductase [Bosea sp. WAO]KUL95529.1 2-dehydropantoate 2-reductase [Bosea sp. WAO]